MAAREIAIRRDPAALTALAQCVAAQQYSTHDRLAYREHERAFRQLLLEWCGNEIIFMMGTLLTEVYEQSFQHVVAEISPVSWEAEHLISGVAAKQRLVELIASGEGAQAERAWRAYLTIYWRRVAAHVGRDRTICVYSKTSPPPSPRISNGASARTGPAGGAKK